MFVKFKSKSSLSTLSRRSRVAGPIYVDCSYEEAEDLEDICYFNVDDLCLREVSRKGLNSLQYQVLVKRLNLSVYVSYNTFANLRELITSNAGDPPRGIVTCEG